MTYGLIWEEKEIKIDHSRTVAHWTLEELKDFMGWGLTRLDLEEKREFNPHIGINRIIDLETTRITEYLLRKIYEDMGITGASPEEITIRREESRIGKKYPILIEDKSTEKDLYYLVAPFQDDEGHQVRLKPGLPGPLDRPEVKA